MYGPSGNGKTCGRCDDKNCGLCANLTNTGCLRCTYDSNKGLKNGACVNCADGEYAEEGECKKCESSCAKCTGLSNCLLCKDLSNTNSTGKCTPCSGDGKYSPLDGINCYDCLDEDCKTCSSNTTKSCTKCKLNTNGIINNIAIDNTCAQCKEGYYSAKDGTTCNKCEDSDCKTCSGSGTSKCTSCKTTSNKISANKCEPCVPPSYPNDGITCITCTTSQFFNGTKCQDCDDSKCSVCDGAGAQKCLDCLEDYFLRGKVCHPCDLGFYFDQLLGCLECDISCEDCSESDVCMTCKDAENTINNNDGTCTCQETSGYFDDDMVCTPCPPLCSACTSATICTGCNEGSTKTDANQLCTCKTGLIQSGLICVNCPNLCLACSSEICQECAANTIATTNSCTCKTDFIQIENKCVAICNNLCTKCDENDSNKCSSCITNAILVSTSCTCTENSAYSIATKQCQCLTGYSLNNGKCVKCLNYILSSEVTDAYFDEKYTSIFVKFSVKMDITQDPSCSKVIHSQSLSKLGKNPICSWNDESTLKIFLGIGWTIRSEFLFLNGINLLKKEGPCSLDYKSLSFLVRKTAEASATVSLQGPSEVSLACGSDNLIYSAEGSTGSLGSVFTYK